MHKSITMKRLLKLVEKSMTSLSNPGICTACGKQADGCEPDARGYECESCGENKVYGAEELLLMIA